MRTLTALLLALFCTLAGAQPAHWPIIGDTRDFVTGKHGIDDAGHRWGAWRYLSADGFRWVSYTAALRRDKVLNLTAQLPGETPAAWATRMWHVNAPLPCSDTAISAICDTARAELARITPPEPPRFVVAKNGTTLTRPVYRLDLETKTVGELIAGKRAPVGVECACWASGVRRNGTAMCAWTSPAGDTRADEVTACAKG
jgi:hypothetical protein